jgi:5S rRNA maturation endonuclease (ribonuclease M5)
MRIKKETLFREIERIKKEKFLFIVEGKKDKIALEELGLKNIFVLNESGKSIFMKIDELSEIALKKKFKCVILTDFDKKGRKLNNMIKRIFLERGIKSNNKFRNLLLKTNLSHIEGINTFLKNIS